MMKKVLLLNLLSFAFLSVFAQTQVGRTTYDLQTNNANCRRVATNAAGEVAITYTRSYGLAESATTDRGTGYNFKNAAGVWSETNFTPNNYARFDQDRTGWANVGLLGNGNEVIVSHFAPLTGSYGGLQVQQRAFGSGTFDTLLLNSSNAAFTFTDDATWPRMAVSGDSIFVLSSTQIGTFVNGVDGGLFTHRSLDGGLTWTQDVLPFVNGNNFVSIGADAYAIDANDDGVIAIVVGRYNTFLIKSMDFGATWTTSKIVEVTDVNGNVTANNFSGESSESAERQDIGDESFSVVVDDEGDVHVWFGRLDYQKDEFAEGSVFPFSEGLMYWNETMDDPKILHASRFTVEAGAGCDPLYTNTVISDPDFIQYSLYSSSFSSQASGGYDDNGNLVVAYTRFRTAIIDASDNVVNATTDGYFFKDVYLLKSSDNGETWEGPFNVSNNDSMECAYPGIPRKIYNDIVPVIWQQDTRPGNALQEPTGYSHGGFLNNEIIYKEVNLASIVTPLDETCPTIALVDAAITSISIYAGCPPTVEDLDSILIIDDVPQGPDESMVRTVGAMPDFTVPGVYTIDMYLEDNAGNTSSDTVQGITITVIADNTPPTYTFVGPDTLAVVSPDTYVDPGLTYQDEGCYPTAAPVITDNVNPTAGASGFLTYEYVITDNSGNSTTAIRYVEVVGMDNIPPVITLNGANTISVEACTFYDELGATAFDLVSYNVPVSINSSNVDINTVGTYLVEYEAVDANSNIATVTRTVNVVDNTAPVLTIIDDNDLATPANSYTEGGINYTYLGETFVAPTTSASDPNCNGQVVTVSIDDSNLDESIAGNYSVEFTAVDENSNPTVQNLTVRVGKEPVADFTFNTTSNGLILTNTSTDNPTSYSWDFDNGQTSTAANSTSGVPTYSSNDASYPTYNVCLTVRNRFNDAPFNKTASTTCKTVDLSVGIADRYTLDAAVEIFPNPTTGLLNIEISETNATNLTVEVTDILGSTIATKELTKVNTTETVTFDLEGNAAGVYFVNISSNNATISKRVIVK